MTGISVESTGKPFVSVIIPVYNDAEGVRMTLESVTDQTYPDEAYEVLAVDNNSNDGTREVIEDFCDRYPQLVHLSVETIQGQSAALNNGIEHTQGSILTFIDADMTVEETWLEDAVDVFSRKDIKYMGCNVEVYVPDEKEETLIAKRDMNLGFPIGMFLDEKRFVGSGCLFVDRQVIDEVGPFDSSLDFAFDQEFGTRVHDAGFDQYFEPDIPMYHPARTSFQELIEKSVRTGRGNVHLSVNYPERFEIRSLLDVRNYLPPNPFRFHSRITKHMNPTPKEVVGIYAITYLAKLARTVGEVCEFIENKQF